MTKQPSSNKKKSAVREWLDSIVFAVVAATLIRWLFFEAFVIPTPSMENSLLVGDYLFVSKMHYGTRTPKTPLQVPLTHQTIWGTKIPSYLDWIQLPQFRLPGFSEVKRGDAVVFNLPVEQEGLVEKYSGVLPDLHPHPVDLRVYYIKRCVAIGGDQIEVRQGQVYINGKPEVNPVRIQNEYRVSSNAIINEIKVFKENGIWEYNNFSNMGGDTLSNSPKYTYTIYTTPVIAARLKEQYDFITEVKEVITPANIKEYNLYPSSPLVQWNQDNYGPLTLPKEGATVDLTPENVALYGEVIQYYEGNSDVKIEKDKILIGGKAIDKYTFKQDYFFMMGDNRHRSADSRYWGMVPKDHVLGKAVFVWMSIDPNPTSLLNKIRWSRVFRTVN